MAVDRIAAIERGAHAPSTGWGPFYELQRRLGLLSDTRLNVGRRARCSWHWPGCRRCCWPFCRAWRCTSSTSVRCCRLQRLCVRLAHRALVLMEQTSDKRMAWLVGQFVAQGIVRDSARPAFLRARQAHGTAHRRRHGSSR